MEFVDKFYSSLHSNKIVSTILTTFLIVYGGMASPNLPGFIRKMFENKIFKILILSLVVYSSNKDPKFAIMMALIFTITLTFIDQKNFFEKFTENTGTPEEALAGKDLAAVKVHCCLKKEDLDYVSPCLNRLEEIVGEANTSVDDISRAQSLIDSYPENMCTNP
jgi:hypothetical protein